MTDKTEPTDTRTRFRLSQETIAIVTGVLALAGLNLATVSDLRDEARAARAAAQADRTAWQAESRQLRDEARADREHFRREILRLTAETAKLAAADQANPQ